MQAWIHHDDVDDGDDDEYVYQATFSSIFVVTAYFGLGLLCCKRDPVHG
jgi:hypothetical protein